MIKEYTKQVMYHAIPHHLLIGAQTDPDQQYILTNSTVFNIQSDAMRYGISLRPVAISCPGSFPFQLLASPQLLADKAFASFMLCKHCSAETKILACYQHSHRKCKMQHIQATRKKVTIAKLGYLPPFYSLPWEEPAVFCFPSAVLHLLRCQTP